MRTLSLTALLLMAALCPAAPALAEKPPRWEYAELTFRSLPGRPKGVDADGNEIAAVPPSMTVKWVSATGEVTTKGWEELAEKLKLLGFKSEGSAALQKIRMLNALGGEGWELMEQHTSSSSAAFPPAELRGERGPGAKRDFDRVSFGSTSTSTWLLKRRMP